MEVSKTLQQSQCWVDKLVVGLNLCPFAKPVIQQNQLKWVETQTEDMDELWDLCKEEVALLMAASPKEVETTLIVHPRALLDFEMFWDFVQQFEDALALSGMDESVQLASFHPDYLFEGEDPQDPSHFTNRSPHPMIHLLRVASVEQVVEQFPDTLGIPEENVKRLQEMGLKEVQDLRDSCL
ncbi:DUF1415 domain-containing protein [Pontibacter sp. G13]|uniref:DUF1415 domain-containing protein n=1 Tax=Pontibacter sp. G13 TaxID=3074898 RepID=UPI002889BF4B|nr:DUF1415 domain-containing protein [Pontibacter sp. G13]WNJ16060.1 DUF1415 domain-containing protein [Pontibacter sp. G13]